jgi:hypothetical protein
MEYEELFKLITSWTVWGARPTAETSAIPERFQHPVRGR